MSQSMQIESEPYSVDLNLPVPSSAINSGRTPSGPWGKRAPQEILGAIFAQLQGKEEFYDSVRHNPPLLRVCRLWNLALRNDPNLWITDILLWPTRFPNSPMGRPSLRPGFQTWLELSKAQKVRLTLRLKSIGTKGRVSVDELAVHIGPSLSYLCIAGATESFGPALLEQLMKMVATGAPNLKSLKLFMFHATEFTRPPLVIQLPVTIDGSPATFPSLEELQITQIKDIFPRISCPRLKKFTCTKTILTDQIGRTSFLRLLHSAPLLESMSLNDCPFLVDVDVTRDNNDRRPEFANLRSLELRSIPDRRSLELHSILGGVTGQEFPSVLRQFFEAGSASLSTLSIDLVTLVASVNSEGFALMEQLPNIEVVELDAWRRPSRQVGLAELRQFFKPSRNLRSLILFISEGNEKTTKMIENILYPGGSIQYPNLKAVQVTGVILTKAQIRRISEKHDKLNLLQEPAERSSKKLRVDCHFF